MKNAVMGELSRYFRPEFINRVDEIIVFHSLSREHLKKIVEIQLGTLRHRLADRQVKIRLTDEAREFLVRVGFDPNYGARPLKRAIRKEIENPLGKMIIQGSLTEGTTVEVDFDANSGELVFQVT